MSINLDAGAPGAKLPERQLQEYLKTGRVEGEHLYILEGADKLITDDSGLWKCFKSDTFNIGPAWEMDIYPQGCVSSGTSRKEDDACCNACKCLSIFMRLQSARSLPDADQPVATFTLTVVNRADPAASLSKRVTQRRQFTHMSAEWGFPRYVKLSVLQSACEQFMPDGNLHIRVKLNVVRRANAQETAHQCAYTDEVLEERQKLGEWLVGGIGEEPSATGAEMVCAAIASNAELTTRIRATRTLMKYGGQVNEFEAALRSLRNTLSSKPATAALLAHSGGDQPHAAVAACLMADPASLQRHISAAKDPQHAACDDDAAKPAASAKPPRRGLPAVLNRALLGCGPRVEQSKAGKY
eukprot:jgi/Ulvmu1/1050/UM105_0006.1